MVMPTPRRKLQNQRRTRICRVLCPTVGEEDIDLHEFKMSVCMRLDVAIALYLATFQYHRDFGGRDRVWNEKEVHRVQGRPSAVTMLTGTLKFLPFR